MNKTILIITGMLAAVIAGVGGFQLHKHHASGTEQETVAVLRETAKSVLGEMRPDFSLPDKDGVLREVKEWNGKVLVINFWATWCPPCREEIPVFIKLQEQYAGEGLQFVGIALQKASEVQAFVAELGVNYPILVGEGEVIQLAEKLGNRIGALPYTVVIDREGRIRFVKPGPLHYEEALAQIKPVL